MQLLAWAVQHVKPRESIPVYMVIRISGLCPQSLTAFTDQVRSLRELAQFLDRSNSEQVKVARRGGASSGLKIWSKSTA